METTREYKRIEAVSKYLKDTLYTFTKEKNMENFIPEFLVVLGSGLGHYAEGEQVNKLLEISYSSIPGFPVSTVEGHKGQFIFATVCDKPVLFMQGRFHYYEGYSLEDVVLGIRASAFMGINKLIVTNAAGGINENFEAGDLMIITDHISTFVPSPLRGRNIEIGTRFPDMSYAYSSYMIEKTEKFAMENNIKIQKGVYFQTSGPQYETPAEVNMIKKLGADAVGMSTACEVIAARHAGMDVFGMSCITNMAAGIQKEMLNHEEVQKTADKAEKNFSKIITHLISGN